MTILPPQAERDSIGIDTYERAILYAASMLRRSFLVDGEKANLKRLSITTAQSKENNNILIEGEFPYSNSTTWEKGGDVFKPVHYLSLSDPSNSFSPPSNLLPLGNPYIALASDPSWVATLEEYFIWVLSQSKAALHLESPPRHDVISYRFFDGRSPDPVVEVKASLPFDLDLWLRDRHFFNALLPLLKYSPTIRAIGISEFTREAVIESTDTKVRIIGNPLFIDSTFTRESTFEVSSKYFKIYLPPVIEFIREGVFSSEGARRIPDFSEFVKESIIAVTQNYVGFAEYTRNSVFDVRLNKKDPIIEQSDFTREAVIDVSSNTEGNAVLDTYNSIVPFTVPATSVSKDHFNFVVYIRFSDLDLGITPDEWDNKSDSQKQAFLQSIRVKPPVGNALPTFIRANYFVNNVASPPTMSADGYIYFLAPFLSSQQDNLFFINFNSFSVTDNPDAKQVFQDYWWVSLSGFRTGIYEDRIWSDNQAPSGLSNNVNAGESWVISSGLDEGFGAFSESELPYPLSVHWESDATDDVNSNSGIETSTISFTDNPTLSLWTTQGIDSLVKIGNLGFDARTQIKTIEDIDKQNNQFKITFWEQFFDDQEIVLVGHSGNGTDGDIVNFAETVSINGILQLDNLEGYGSFLNNEEKQIREDHKYRINKIDQNWFELINVFTLNTFDIGTENDQPYSGNGKIAGNIDLQSTKPEMPVNATPNYPDLVKDSFRRYDRTVNDAYLNGNGQGSDTLTSVLNGALNARLYNSAGVSYIKLAKYTKSQQRIIDEYNNEINPTNFYQVGTVKEISEFTREAIYEVSEQVPNYITTVLADNPVAFWLFERQNNNGDYLDEVNNQIATQFYHGYQRKAISIVKDVPSSIELDGDDNVRGLKTSALNGQLSENIYTIEFWFIAETPFPSHWNTQRAFIHQTENNYQGYVFQGRSNISSFKALNKIIYSNSDWRNRINHLVLSVNNNHLTAYLNGSIVSQNNIDPMFWNVVSEMFIVGGDSLWKSKINGNLTAYAFYDYALTTTQVQKHYQKGI
jgi:hypothetical protein